MASPPSLWERIRNFFRTEPQGSEGVATVKISTKDGTTENLIGFIVQNNQDLNRLIDPKQSCQSYREKYRKTAHFVYIPAIGLPQNKQYETAEIIVYTSQAEAICCKVEQLDEKIARVEPPHQFIPCESVSFNKNSFLKKYSKKVPSEQLAEKTRFYGLSDDKNSITSIDLKRCELDSSNFCFELDDNVFDQLTDGPLLLEDKTCLAGYLQKCSPNEGQIKLYLFDKEEAIDVWKTSTFQPRQATESDDSATTLAKMSVIENAGRSTSYTNDDNNDTKMKNDNNDSDGDVDGDGEANAEANGDGCADTIVVDDGGRDDTINADVPEDSNYQHENDPANNGRSDSGSHGDVANDDAINEESDEDRSYDRENDLTAVPETLNGRNDSSSDADVANGEESSFVENVATHSPVERSMSYVSGHFPIEEQANDTEDQKTTLKGLMEAKFCKLYEYDSSVLQDLAIILDKKHSTLKPISSLADKLKAHPLIKDKCQSNYNHSPASELLDLPAVAMRPIQKLITELKSGEKQAIASLIKENIGKDDPEKKSIEEFFQAHFELKETVAAKLEGCGDSFDWLWLGKKFGIDQHLLEQIQRGTNPAENFLVDYAYHSVPRLKLQIKQFLDDMTSLGRKDETLKLFKRFHINKDKYFTSTLKDEFKPNTEQMEELCKLLNKSNCKGWQHLAALWEIEDTTYYYYIPDTKASPTTILFDWLMMRRPDFTAYEISVICCQLKRNDASETLAKHLEQFYKNCVDSSATISYLTLLAVIEADAKRRC